MVAYHADRVYLAGLRDIMENGTIRKDRTGVGTIGLFGTQERYDLTKGFPLLTSKKIYTRGVFGELLWFLQGRTDVKWLQDRNIHIWDEWKDERGEIGPGYGWQWRNFDGPYMSQEDRDAGLQLGVRGVDQIQELLKGLKKNPFSRRHVVSAWNPNQMDDMALPPCHTMFQFYVSQNGADSPLMLSCGLYQRSRDTFLGSPFNIASYALLTHLVADWVGMVPHQFVHTTGDAHVYLNHFEQVEEQLSRIDRLPDSPTLRIEHPVDVSGLDFEDMDFLTEYSVENFIVANYNPLPTIKAPVAV